MSKQKKTDQNNIQTSDKSWKEVSVHREISSSGEYKHSETVKRIEVGKIVDRNTNDQRPPALI